MGHVQTILSTEIERESISQAELARASGLSRATVNRLVNGNAEINPEWAIRLEYALGVDAEDLYVGEAKEKLDEARSRVPIGQIQSLS